MKKIISPDKAHAGLGDGGGGDLALDFWAEQEEDHRHNRNLDGDDAGGETVSQGEVSAESAAESDLGWVCRCVDGDVVWGLCSGSPGPGGLRWLVAADSQPYRRARSASPPTDQALVHHPWRGLRPSPRPSLSS